MDTKDVVQRDSFTSKLGIIAAVAGSAVGLGNIWKFPYITGVYGGGAFVLVYLICIVLIGLPIVLSEFIIGRKAQKNAIGSFKKLAPGTLWFVPGLMGLVAAFMILAFYGVVAGWTLEYLFKAITNSFVGKNPADLEGIFGGFISQIARPIFWQFIFMGLTCWIVLAGIKGGIEKTSKLLMPVLLVIIIILDIRAVTLAGASEGLAFLFKPDFSKLTGEGMLNALGHAFFSLSLGMGTLITYSSYMSKQENLATTAVQVTIADTGIALLAGIAIFPAVFAFGIEPGAGPGLVFITLPNVFQQMPGGYFFCILFFLLLAVAALTSSISILEVVVAYFVEELKLARRAATIMAASAITIMGIPCSLSMGVWSKVKFMDKTFFDWLDFIASNVMLPLGGLLIVAFVGWYLGREKTEAEVTNEGQLKAGYLPLFMFLAKFVAPVVIAIVFLHGLGLF
ncbi:MAG: sodium-dependent transporter [Thermodesulfobacteriota bacterium]|nr:sodium-dependent transporter [Thermodesulfobacteriota bacterium]